MAIQGEQIYHIFQTKVQTKWIQKLDGQRKKTRKFTFRVLKS